MKKPVYLKGKFCGSECTVMIFSPGNELTSLGLIGTIPTKVKGKNESGKIQYEFKDFNGNHRICCEGDAVVKFSNGDILSFTNSFFAEQFKEYQELEKKTVSKEELDRADEEMDKILNPNKYVTKVDAKDYLKKALEDGYLVPDNSFIKTGAIILKGVNTSFYGLSIDEMNFDEKKDLPFGIALEYVRQLGKKMRLPQWKEDVFISAYVPEKGDVIGMTAPYLYVTSRFGRVPWKETMIELFSTDWEVID